MTSNLQTPLTMTTYSVSGFRSEKERVNGRLDFVSLEISVTGSDFFSFSYNWHSKLTYCRGPRDNVVNMNLQTISLKVFNAMIDLDSKISDQKI